MWHCPHRFQLFPLSAMIAPSVQDCFHCTKLPGKGSRIFKEVWVWLTLSQVVCAAWAAAAFTFGYLEFVFDASAVAASAGAWNVFSLLKVSTVLQPRLWGSSHLEATTASLVLRAFQCLQLLVSSCARRAHHILWCSVADCSICTLLVFTDAVCWPSVIAGCSFPLFSGKILFGILEVCWRVISSRDSVSVLHGHVLGLRIEQAKVAVTFAFLFLFLSLEGFLVFVRCFCLSEAEVVVQQHAAAASEYMEEQPGGLCERLTGTGDSTGGRARDLQFSRIWGGARRNRNSEAKFPGLPGHTPGSSSRHVLLCWYARC